jgi:hypothetical protein
MTIYAGPTGKRQQPHPPQTLVSPSLFPLHVLRRTHPHTSSSRPKAAHLPPQWRDPRISPLLFPLHVLEPHPPTHLVISTEGGAPAAAVERPPHFAFALSFACSRTAPTHTPRHLDRRRRTCRRSGETPAFRLCSFLCIILLRPWRRQKPVNLKPLSLSNK